jgi:hypothetical protein
MVANPDFILEEISLDRRAQYINVTRRLLRVSNDALKLLSKTALPLLSAYLPPLKTPLELTNALLQIFAVQFDDNYPMRYKLLMSSALCSLMIASLATGLFLPSLQMASVLLTSYSHLIRTIYRASKLHLSLEKLSSIKNEVRNTKCEMREEAKLLTLFKQDRPEFEKKVTPYLKESTAKAQRLSNAELIMMKNAVGVATILLRWAVSIAIIMLASSSTSVIVPLITASLLINSIDLLRDLHNEWQLQNQEHDLNQRQGKLLKQFKSKT